MANENTKAPFIRRVQELVKSKRIGMRSHVWKNTDTPFDSLVDAQKADTSKGCIMQLKGKRYMWVRES